MKKVLFLLIGLFILSNPAITHSQNDVTKFLGIPVDGGKEEFVKQLCSKGFNRRKHPLRDQVILEGIFNGQEVYIYIFETNDKVSRVAVIPQLLKNERDIKIEFNNLCYQFLKKDNYVALDNEIAIPDYEDMSISRDENIGYEMRVNNKDYQVSFIQLPAPKDSVLKSIEPQKHVSINISSPTGEKIDANAYFEMLSRYSKNSVWFRIEEQNGNYYIAMFYDNGDNRSNGEDL